MTAVSVSVVVVSQGRPDALARCLLGLSQLQYDTFEIIVVADLDGCTAAQALPFGGALKVIPFQDANISAARNAGIDASGGAVVAFIDDDAVPEPTWLGYLTAALTDDIAAVGGFVLGRNGMSYQWKARQIDPDGHAHPVTFDEQMPGVPQVPDGWAVKTEGTNMALRRDVLVKLGGFDPAYRFFLDETDVNVRLARTGLKTALAPLALVHHGFAASARRREDRVPRDLFDIGASWAVFHRKHLPAERHADQRAQILSSERRRLVRHMISGGLEPRDVRRLMRRLNAGFDAGSARALTPHHVSDQATSPFLPFPSVKRASVVQTSHWSARKQARTEASRSCAQGNIVTLFLLSYTPLRHHCRFTSDGVWEQSGGVFGRSDRSRPGLAFGGMSSRVKREVARVAKARNL